VEERAAGAGDSGQVPGVKAAAREPGILDGGIKTAGGGEGSRQRGGYAGNDDAVHVVIGDGLVPHDQRVQRVADRDDLTEPGAGRPPVAQRLYHLVVDVGVGLSRDLAAGRAGAVAAAQRVDGEGGDATDGHIAGVGVADPGDRAEVPVVERVGRAGDEQLHHATAPAGGPGRA